MAQVYFPTALQRLTGGLEECEVQASTVRELVSRLEDRFPGIGEQLASAASSHRRGYRPGALARETGTGDRNTLPPGHQRRLGTRVDSRSLLVYGDASIDIGLRIEDFPTAGLDTPAHHPLLTPGGSAANCAAAAARLGTRVNLVARVGNDLFSHLLTEDLDKHGIGSSAVENTEGPSSLVVALIDPRGQRTFVSARGPASGRIPPEVYLPLLDEASMVHLSGYSFQDPGSRLTGSSSAGGDPTTGSHYFARSLSAFRRELSDRARLAGRDRLSLPQSP